MADNKQKPGARITKEVFDKMHTRYHAKHPDKTKSVLFGKECIQQIIDNPLVEHVAIYMGQNDDEANTVMVIGTDGNRTLLFDTATDSGQPCPPYC